MALSIKSVQELSALRADRWHDGDASDWSPLEWAGAMCGEAGEAANFAKKLKRIQSHMRNVDKSQNYFTTDLATAVSYKKSIAKECADAILYAIILIDQVGHDAEEIVREVFNTKSIEYDFPERLE